MVSEPINSSILALPKKYFSSPLSAIVADISRKVLLIAFHHRFSSASPFESSSSYVNQFKNGLFTLGWVLTRRLLARDEGFLRFVMRSEEKRATEKEAEGFLLPFSFFIDDWLERYKKIKRIFEAFSRCASSTHMALALQMLPDVRMECHASWSIFNSWKKASKGAARGISSINLRGPATTLGRAQTEKVQMRFQADKREREREIANLLFRSSISFSPCSAMRCVAEQSRGMWRSKKDDSRQLSKFDLFPFFSLSPPPHPRLPIF
jgi:hypothetical protein